MTQQNVSSKPGATYLGIESTFGTQASTMVRLYPVEESVEVDWQQDELPNESEQPSLLQTPDPVRGLKSTGSSAKFRHYVRPHATQMLNTALTVTPPCMIPIKACLGGESFSHNSGTGTTVGASATTTSIPVASATGLAKGQWIIISISSVFYPTRIVDVVSNTLTVNPALPSVPPTGSGVVGMANYYATEQNTQSLTFQRALTGDANLQWLGLGCLPEFELKMERGQIIEYSLGLKAANWAGPTALGISTAIAADVMDKPLPMREGLVILQGTGTTTRTHYPLRSAVFRVNPGLIHVPELVGSTEGVVGVMRVGNRPFVEATVRFTADTARDTNWVNQDKLQLAVMAAYGSGTLRRWFVVDLPTCVPVGKPKFMMDGGMVVAEQKFHAQLSALTGTPAFVPGTTDLAYSPIVIAVG